MSQSPRSPPILPSPVTLAAAKEAHEESCSTVGGIFEQLQWMLKENSHLGELDLDKDEPVDDKLLTPDLLKMNEKLTTISRLCKIMMLKMDREADKCRYRKDDLGNADLEFVAADLEMLRKPRAVQQLIEMSSLREAARVSQGTSKRQRTGEK